MKITRNERGSHALNRVISFIGAMAMTIAFIKEAWTNSLVWLDYIGFALGMTITYSPVLGAKLLRILAPYFNRNSVPNSDVK
jgi:hypothetical protein